ncbi:hypothetical protein CNR22_23690 [Sphingobacteriaceae bacterium]|nr:hypothetical protein CNR22_23690 [Sphingobacteriaceae bacterium]
MTAIDVMVKMVQDRWLALLKNFDRDLDLLTDEQLQKEIAPGKNRGVYLLGHLLAVHDEMIVLLGFGDKLYPELHEAFLKSPDKAISTIPSAKELRALWTKHKEFLNQRISGLKTAQWFEKHTAVSEEDFNKEPHRNKLNILLTRASHLAYHAGQFVLLK